jgi:ADP-ribose pyrophosphatase YjhB (NUDIX family)
MTDQEEWPGDWSGRIRATARAVIRHEDRILGIAAREPGTDLDFCFLPGGGMRFGETSEEAVRRELREELAIEPREVRLLGVIENRFTWVGDPHQTLEFVYEVLGCEPPVAELGRLEVVAGDDHEATWWPLAAFDGSGTPLYPDGVLDLIAGG